MRRASVLACAVTFATSLRIVAFMICCQRDETFGTGTVARVGGDGKIDVLFGKEQRTERVGLVVDRIALAPREQAADLAHHAHGELAQSA